MVATHSIEIEATINNDWDEKKIREYCINKLCFEVDSIWDPELKSLEVNQKTVKANILIQSTYYYFMEYEEEIKNNIKTWIKNHVTEPGIVISKVNMKYLGSRIRLTEENGRLYSYLEPIKKHEVKNIKIL